MGILPFYFNNSNNSRYPLLQSIIEPHLATDKVRQFSNSRNEMSINYLNNGRADYVIRMRITHFSELRIDSIPNNYRYYLIDEGMNYKKVAGACSNTHFGKAVINKTNTLHDQNITLSVPLYSGANQITAIAYNKNGQASDPRYLSVFSSQKYAKKPNLHILSIGVNSYEKLPLSAQLTYARSDAEHFINRFNAASNSMYNTIKNTFLPDDKAYQQAIIDSIDSLSLADKDDLIMLFFAGHGVQDPKNDRFYLVTHDTDIKNLADSAIDWQLLSEHISQLNSRVIIFLDACHSGSISNQTVVPNNELAEKFFNSENGGIMVYSAAKGRQYAQESESFGSGEGLFSYAISKALDQEGKTADYNGNGFIEFSELIKFVQKFVDDFSDGQQTPWLSHKEMFGDIPLAVVKN